MGIINLKAPKIYYASFWSYNFSILLDGGPKLNISMIFGLLELGPLGNPYLRILIFPNILNNLRQFQEHISKSKIFGNIGASKSLNILENRWCGHENCQLFLVGPKQSSISSVFKRKRNNRMVES